MFPRLPPRPWTAITSGHDPLTFGAHTEIWRSNPSDTTVDATPTPESASPVVEESPEPVPAHEQTKSTSTQTKT